MAKILTAAGKLFIITTIFLIVASFGVPRFNQYAEAVSDQNILDMTNRQRKLNDLPPLIWNAALSSSAWQKAQDMCNQDYWAHRSPSGEKAWDLMERNDYRYTFAGENLAKGYDTDSERVIAWMLSPAHRDNILKSDYTEVGTASINCDFQGRQSSITVAHYGAR